MDRVGKPWDSISEAAAKQQSDEVVRGFRKVVADNYALGQCEFAVISNSGFGRQGVWRTRIPHANVRVLSDGELHELEDNTLWRIAELLGVDRRDRILERQKAKAEASAPAAADE